MAFSQWRRFNFFGREVLKDSTSNEPLNFLKDVKITASASGRGQMLFGDNEGFLYCLSRDLNLTKYRIYEIDVSHLYQLKQHSILISVGKDEMGINPVIKVWNFNKLDRVGNPTCVKYIRALAGGKAVQVSCIAVLENMSQMAIGFVDGTVVVVNGDITNTRFGKQRVIHEARCQITGLGYKEVGSSVILYVTTRENVLSFNTTAKDQKNILDHFGTELNCSAVCELSDKNQFIIGNPDALYLYLPDVRTICLPFEGEKKLVTWFRGYLVVVNTDVKQLAKTAIAGTKFEMNDLSIYDVNNKFIAFQMPFPDIVAVLGEWGSLHVVTADGKIFQLAEKDTYTKLQTLFKKNLYETAINLARSQHYSDGLIEIFRIYGDHLYTKGDHDGAIKQYVQTIGHLEPSYVIRKFLDAQRTKNLTEYLQALHEKGLANNDHTTLLLNCYTKLKAVDKINEFIKTDKEVNFDVETAIKVCQQAGYYSHALELAEKFDQHEWYLKIQLEDIKEYKEALTYMKRLPFLEAETNLKLYGKKLMQHVPDKTTDFLKELCTDYQPLLRKSQPEVKKEQGELGGTSAIVMAGNIIMSPVEKRTVMKAYPDDFIHIFVHHKSKLKEFLQHMVKMRDDCSNVVYNTLLELYLHDASAAIASKNYENGASEEEKAYDLLTNSKSRYDLDHAMVITQMHNFKRGILYLYEKAHSFQQILCYHMDHNDYDAIIQDCQKYGTKDPTLWNQALAYFSKKEESCKSHIIQVLNHIDKCNLLSPLMVIDTLAHNSTATLGVVKDYVIKRLQQENEQIAKDERMIRKYREDTDKMRVQIDEMKTSAKIFQSSKCMICSRPLDLPVVHFLCGDSFHQTCFESYADSDNECPVCAPENRKVMDIIKAQENNKSLHEQFNTQLERSADGFSVVADYFGRGVFKKVSVFSDAKTPNESMQDPTGYRDMLLT